ncbi:MAG TPA: TrbI/VirB10 family protein [Candidatus Binataceae bacterium]|nr:TrbI/VirB10 family protein [Candidatus Binataceae bacterium]
MSAVEPTPIVAPTPHGVSLWFGLALGGGLLLGLTTFVLATRRPATEPAAPALREARGDGAWVDQAHPTPSPQVAATFAPLALSTPLPAAPYQHPYVLATPDEATLERQRRYQRALAADVMIKPDRQVRDLPQLDDRGAKDSSAPLTVAAKPAPPHTLTAWSFIYGTLETGIQSDHPGDVLGRVSQDVKDSVTQTEVLIPMCSKLHGYQSGSAQVQTNDSSLLVTWDDIELPHGAHIHLPQMPGTDPEGYPGFADLVNHHYARTWTPAVLISAITAGSMLASHPTYGSINGYNAEQQALASAGASLGSRATSQLDAAANQTKPTITIEPGYHFRVLVTRDLTFAGAYGG